jgi:hypothetical protein
MCIDVVLGNSNFKDFLSKFLALLVLSCFQIA